MEHKIFEKLQSIPPPTIRYIRVFRKLVVWEILGLYIKSHCSFSKISPPLDSYYPPLFMILNEQNILILPFSENVSKVFHFHAYFEFF